MGAVWLIAMRDSTVRTIEPDGTIVTASSTGRDLRIYLQPPDPGAVLAWSLTAVSAGRH